MLLVEVVPSEVKSLGHIWRRWKRDANQPVALVAAANFGAVTVLVGLCTIGGLLGTDATTRWLGAFAAVLGSMMLCLPFTDSGANQKPAGL